jgi:hypothetical protein
MPLVSLEIPRACRLRRLALAPSGAKRIASLELPIQPVRDATKVRNWAGSGIEPVADKRAVRPPGCDPRRYFAKDIVTGPAVVAHAGIEPSGGTVKVTVKVPVGRTSAIR